MLHMANMHKRGKDQETGEGEAGKGNGIETGTKIQYGSTPTKNVNTHILTKAF